MALIGEFEVAAREAEGQEPDQFRFAGELFTVGKVGLIPLGRFAKAAVSGLDSADMEGLAAMLDMLSDTVIDDDGPRLLEVARKNRADAEDLMPIIQAIIQAESGRPTRQPSDSSSTLSRTGENSKESSPSDPRRAGLVPVEQAAMSLAG